MLLHPSRRLAKLYIPVKEAETREQRGPERRIVLSVVRTVGRAITGRRVRVVENPARHRRERRATTAYGDATCSQLWLGT